MYFIVRSIYKLHDDVKDKDFELELSWICDDSNKVHVSVPEDLRQESIAKAIAEKEREEMGDSDEE